MAAISLEEMSKTHEFYDDLVSHFLDADFVKVRKGLSSSELSRSEKVLLKAKMKYRVDKDFQGAIDMLDSIKNVQEIYLQAERYFLLAYLNGELHRYDLSLAFYDRCIDLYAKTHQTRKIGFCLYTKSKHLFQLGFDEYAYYMLEKTKAYVTAPRHLSYILRTMAIYNLSKQELNQAEKNINESMVYAEKLGPTEKDRHNISSADVYFAIGKHKKSLQLLKSLKKSPTKVALIGEVMLKTALIEAFDTNKKMGFPPEEVQSSNVWDLKWRIVDAIQGGEKQKVEKLWKKLVKAVPHVYSPGFDVTHEKHKSQIFYCTVLKYLTPASVKEVVKVEKKQNQFRKGSKLNLLLEILVNTQMPLSKENLIEMIWKCDYDPSFDDRFHKLIERFKKKSCYTLILENRAYSLGTSQEDFESEILEEGA